MGKSDMDQSNIIKKIYNAINNRNITALYKCFHSKNLSALANREQYINSFEQYNLDIQLKKLSIVGQDEEFIVIKDEINTRKKSGAEFKDNRSKNIHVLAKDNDDEWKVINSNIIGITLI